METATPDAVTDQADPGYPLRGEMYQTRTIVAEVLRPGFSIADLKSFVEADYFQFNPDNFDPDNPDGGDVGPYVRTRTHPAGEEVITLDYVVKYAPGVYDVLDEKTFKHWFRPGNRCTSMFIPPWDPAKGEKQRTFRCEGVANHRGPFHGGRAFEDPESHSGWQDPSSTEQHPGEPFILKLSEVSAAIDGIRLQRDQAIGAYQQYLDATRAIAALATAAGPDNPFGTAVLSLLDQIPAWARPGEPDPSGDSAEPTADTAAKG